MRGGSPPNGGAGGAAAGGSTGTLSLKDFSAAADPHPSFLSHSITFCLPASSIMHPNF